MDNMPDVEGPFENSRRLSPDEYGKALNLYLELQHGTQPTGIGIARDPTWPQWVFLQLAHATISGNHVIVALPLTDGEWGTAAASGFWWVTAASPIEGRASRGTL